MNSFTGLSLKSLPLDMEDKETAIMVDAALEWVSENVSLKLDPEATELPNTVKLFVVKYCELMSQPTGVASESLGGMSQSFTTSNGAAALGNLAEQIFGAAYKGRNRFIAAISRWK